jgi:hypothetical protein
MKVRPGSTPLLIVLATLVVAAAFVVFTDNRWEDYYITYRTSRNLVDGHGLVYQPGEKLHTFTSPLGVLLPAAALAATGGSSDEAALALFRALCAGALATACVLLWQVTGRWQWSPLARALAAFLPLLEAKTVMFSLNGMETAFMLLFIVLGVRALSGDLGRTWPALGCAWAGLMWTRPDGFVFGGVAAAAWWFVRPGELSGLTRGRILILYLKAAAVAAALYAPWVIWAWNYYGSPIPHTILAKGSAAHAPALADLPLHLLNQTLFFPWQGALRGVFLPTYVWYSDWPALLRYWMHAAAWLALGYCLWPRANRAGRAASLCFVLTSLYVSVAPRAPWYLPSHAIMAGIALAAVAQDLAQATRDRLWWRRTAQAVLAAHLAVAVANLGLAFWHVRVQQELVENQRRDIGRWIRELSPGGNETVFLEPLGYVGYFSGLKMLDSPGLSSPEMVRAIQDYQGNWTRMIPALRPTWLVLRRHEAQATLLENPKVLTEDYHLWRTFDVSDRLAAVPLLPGRIHLEYDQTYDVFHRARP